MRIELVPDKYSNELIINAYDDDGLLLESQKLSAESLESFDIGKIIKFLKKLQAIINKLLEIYCKG